MPLPGSKRAVEIMSERPLTPPKATRESKSDSLALSHPDQSGKGVAVNLSLSVKD